MPLVKTTTYVGEPATAPDNAYAIAHYYEATTNWFRAYIIGGGAGGSFNHANHTGAGGGAGGCCIMVANITRPVSSGINYLYASIGKGGLGSLTGIGANGNQSVLYSNYNGVGWDNIGVGVGGYSAGFAVARSGWAYNAGDNTAAHSATYINLTAGCGFTTQTKFAQVDGYGGRSFFGHHGAYGSGGMGNDGVQSGDVLHGQPGVIIIEEYR